MYQLKLVMLLLSSFLCYKRLPFLCKMSHFKEIHNVRFNVLVKLVVCFFSDKHWNLIRATSFSKVGSMFFSDKQWNLIRATSFSEPPISNFIQFRWIVRRIQVRNIKNRPNEDFLNKWTNSKRQGAGKLSGIALDYGLDDRGFESRRGLGIFLFTTAFRPALGLTQPPVQWVQGALSLGVKRPGREADHSPPSSANTLSWRGAQLKKYKKRLLDELCSSRAGDQTQRTVMCDPKTVDWPYLII
jgi:hypothetical protein